MQRLIVGAILAYFLALAGTLAGLYDPSLGSILPIMFCAKTAVLALLALAMVISIWPHSSIPIGAALFLAGGRVCVHFWFPDWEPQMNVVLMVACGVAALPALFLLSVARRVGAWLCVIAYLLGCGFVVSLALPPASQFDATMAAMITVLILAAMLVASGFTFLFLKTFEKVGENFLHAFLLFLPVMGAPFYLIARLLSDQLGSGPGTPGWWAGLSLAWDATLALEAALLLVVWLAGKRFSSGHFVPLVAWKFLKSQRQVYTWHTRWILALRSLTPQRLAGRSMSAVALEIVLVAAIPAVALLLGDQVSAPLAAYPLIRLLAAALAAAWLGVRALTGSGVAELLYGTAALGAAALVFRLVWPAQGVSFLSPQWVLALAGVMVLPATLFLLQLTTRLVLWRRLVTGRLGRALDPRLAPPVETRLKQGIGASSFVSVVGVSIGVWALIVVLSVMSGFSGELKNRIVNTKDHLMLKAGREAEQIRNPVELRARLQAIPGIRSASPYVEGEAMMSSNVNISATVTVRGIPRDLDALTFLERSLVSGSTHFFRHPEDMVPFPGVQLYNPFPDTPTGLTPLPAPGQDVEPAPADWLFPMPETEPGKLPWEDTEAQPEIVDGLLAMPTFDDDTPEQRQPAVQNAEGVLRPVIIGLELARSMGVTVGSRITVISPDGDVGPMGVQPRVRQFLVAAVFQTGMYDYDLKLAYMFLPDAQKFFGLGNLVDHMDVRLTDLKQTDAVRDVVQELVAPAGIEVMTWKQLNRNLFSALELERIVMFVVLGFIILIASFNIVTSLVIIIRKRLAAISILRTMGARVGHITGVFFLLGAAVGLFGTAAGVIMGLSSCGIISQLGLTLPKEYYIRSLPIAVDGLQVVQIAVAALVITALASLYPGRLASRIILVEGLKDER